MKFYERVLVCGMTQCLSEDTKVLTRDGWKTVFRVNDDDEIYIYDIVEKVFKWEIPNRWNIYNGKYKSYKISSKKHSTSQVVTSNHRIVYFDGDDLKISKVEELVSMGVKKLEIPTMDNDRITCEISDSFIYIGTVFCPTVSTGTFVAKRIGKPVITGNSGKTTFLKEGVIPYLPRWVAYDPDLHFGDVKGVTICNTFDEFDDAFPYENKIAFQPEDDVMGNFDKRVAEFEQVCEKVNRLGANLTFIIDEIAHVTVKRDRAIIPQELQKMIKRRMKKPEPERPQGRIGVFVTTQRPKDAAVDFLTQCQHIIAFKLLPRDIKYVQEAFPVGVDVKDIINYKLKKYQAIHYEVGTQRMYVEELGKKKSNKLRKKNKSVDDESIDDFLNLLSKKEPYGLKRKK